MYPADHEAVRPGSAWYQCGKDNSRRRNANPFSGALQSGTDCNPAHRLKIKNIPADGKGIQGRAQGKNRYPEMNGER
jgi:hypothetical protein